MVETDKIANATETGFGTGVSIEPPVENVVEATVPETDDCSALTPVDMSCDPDNTKAANEDTSKLDP